ncbi:hypothetical protein ABZW18_17130 [Streptomyces sp. NPDC004647]|uniref:hypothetical protein n=1 Tax=Streptomyces sp. NPDC004647 TaxID=3154671 RepID=UPI0033B4FECF
MRGLTTAESPNEDDEAPEELAGLAELAELEACEARGTAVHLIRTGTAAAGAAAVGLLLAGCGTGGEGVRTEGPARPGAATKVTPTDPALASSAAPTKDEAVALVKKDRKVSVKIRESLNRCVGEYPVDVSYGKITGGRANDVVVNVLSCGDAIGVGSYVYRESADRKRYENVFVNEEQPVYAEISKGDLEVTRQVYGPGDDRCCPSGEDVLTYRWAGDGFTVHGRVHSDFSKSVNGAEPTAAPEQ